MRLADIAAGKRYVIKGDIVLVTSIDEKPNTRTSKVHFRVVVSNAKSRPVGYARTWGLANFASGASFPQT